MSGRTLQLIIAAVFVLHGIGHVMGILPIVGASQLKEGWNSRSWLLTDRLGAPPANAISIIIWVACMVGFTLAGLAIMDWVVPYAWWRGLALGSAILSLMGIVLYPNSFVMWFNMVGAIAVDVAVIVGLLLLSWPADVDLGIV